MIDTTDMVTLADLEQQATEEFWSWLEQQHATHDEVIREKICELTEDPCPASTTAILGMAVADNWLAAAEPDSEPYESTAVMCIRQNVADHLGDMLWEIWRSAQAPA